MHVSHGVDTFSNKPVRIAKNLCDRKLQRAPIQFFEPENWFTVRDAPIQANPAK